MERLTKKWGNNCVPTKLDLEYMFDMSDEQAEQLQAIIKKLADYEEAEEQGLLLRLPCKVGDTVYQITRDFISEYRIRNFICYDNGNIWFDWECTKGIYINVRGFHIDDIGKTVFLTKEEAEQKLAEMKGE